MKIVWEIFDLIVIITFMLLGMAITNLYDIALWLGALGGLGAHYILRNVLRTIRNHVRL